MADVYERDVLEEWDERRAAARRPAPSLELRAGLAVSHRQSGFHGVVVRAASGAVELRADDGTMRLFRLADSAFVHEGRLVTLIAPRPRAGSIRSTNDAAVTASGSVAVRHQARVARGSRVLVEGVHDAELVEQVWGDDLRYEGVVVERLDGLDHLSAWLDDFRPEPGRRVGVLVDHLVPGSKEARIAAAVRDPHVLVTGTPFVDVWQAVHPRVVGLERWPAIPMGTDWKTGICAAVAAAGATEPVEPSELWRRLKAGVRTYADLAPELVGAVERLIDFVTES